MRCVRWAGAKAYCESVDARLPTADEWTAIATGGGNRVWPRGDGKPSCQYAVIDGQTTLRTGNAGSLHRVVREGRGCGTDAVAPVCSRRAGRTSEGVCDLIGNVAEWLADSSAAGRGVAGGHFASTESEVRVPLQQRGPTFVALDTAAPTIGFRCVRD